MAKNDSLKKKLFSKILLFKRAKTVGECLREEIRWIYKKSTKNVLKQ